MINDSVREELKPKISPAAKKANFEIEENSPVPEKSNQPVNAALSSPKIMLKTTTMELAVKATSPTLVEFHNKNAALPEWRLQLQNVVRKRHQQTEPESNTDNTDLPSVRQTKLVTSGANALKAEVVEETAPPVDHKNPTLNSALRRIEKSRRQFFEDEKPSTAPVTPAQTANKNYPFYIASKQTEVAPKPANINPPVTVPTKLKMATSLKTPSKPLNTNKLPPLPKPAKISTSFIKPPAVVPEVKPKNERKIEAKKLIEKEDSIEEKIIEDAIVEEIDDCAPLAMRFNAGLFDLIIGFFASLLLLTPFLLAGESWFTFSGFFTLLTTCAAVMFVYMTTAIGIYGRTIGMLIFSLEVIDIEGEEYPTIIQAAVSSAVYLLSLALGGIGFLTLLSNEDKRALHDLVSRTIVVKEF
ncbi:hypothetical protein BH18ACI1_BH18ACI1_04860 [soil metagenome]